MTEIKTKYMNPYAAGVLLGIVLFISFAIFGHGLGASGGVAKIVGTAVDTVYPGHAHRNAYLVGLIRGSTNPLDNWLVFEILGIIIGGFISGLLAAQGTAALASYCARGFCLERRIRLGGWLTLVLARRGRKP